MRYVYNYDGNRTERLAYTEKGELNQKHHTFFNDKGYEIEWTGFEIRKTEYGDSKYSVKYESFDKNGNWTKRIHSKLEIEKGKEVYKPNYIEYRTITYYP